VHAGRPHPAPTPRDGGSGRSPGIRFPIGERLAFPHGLAGRGDVPDGLPPERIVVADNLDALEPALERCFDAFGLCDNAAGVGDRGVRALTDAVAGWVHMRRHTMRSRFPRLARPGLGQHASRLRLSTAVDARRRPC
jgi:hypothetical protein